MGYSIRTELYRFVLWANNGFTSKEPFTNDRVYAKELDDYKKDPLETINVADDTHYASLSKEMYDKMLAFFKNRKCYRDKGIIFYQLLFGL
ncbi:hypothetical protein [Parasediminibacterium sp. JCM 36343]|uniref:hypothetical protein n=1 Tax=Parasediminibacterium sp. JCM 36343 TaxID=3374279 RepID=UPI00397E26B4